MEVQDDGMSSMEIFSRVKLSEAKNSFMTLNEEREKTQELALDYNILGLTFHALIFHNQQGRNQLGNSCRLMLQ